jgi:hypothetical protein
VPTLPCIAFCQYKIENHSGIIIKMIFKLVGEIGIPSVLQALKPSLILFTIIFTLLLFLPNCMLSPFSFIIAAATQDTKTA